MKDPKHQTEARCLFVLRGLPGGGRGGGGTRWATALFPTFTLPHKQSETLVEGGPESVTLKLPPKPRSYIGGRRTAHRLFPFN